MNMRKWLCAAFAAVMTVVTAMLLFACNTDGMAHVSERRSGYYTASDDMFTVTAVSGVREDPFTVDGTVGKLKPYTLVTVTPAEFDVDAMYTYTAATGLGEYGGALVVHPFAASFSAEFDAETTGETLTVKIKNGETEREYVLTSLVTAETVSFVEAIVEAEKILGKPDCAYEIRARLINNPLDKSGELCWHVGFYGVDYSAGVLLDPVTAKAIAVKSNA